jgi:pilus assembly protein FimV
MKEKALKCLLCFICWCLAPAASALSLSQITLNSHLNQPLDARVELTGLDSGDLAGLNVLIHYPDAGNYQQVMPLKHEVKEDQGGHYIHITTTRPIKEPIVTFTLEVDWAGGRYSREYTLLIDPE